MSGTPAFRNVNCIQPHRMTTDRAVTGLAPLHRPDPAPVRQDADAGNGGFGVG